VPLARGNVIRRLLVPVCAVMEDVLGEGSHREA
jgi:hypothetical protein